MTFASTAPISPRRKRLALIVAIIADIVLWCTFPWTIEGFLSPVEDVRDVLVALILLCLVGFRWQLAAAFLIELVPGLDLCPTWTAFVLLLPTVDPAAPNLSVAPVVTVHTVSTQPPPVLTMSKEP